MSQSKTLTHSLQAYKFTIARSIRPNPASIKKKEKNPGHRGSTKPAESSHFIPDFNRHVPPNSRAFRQSFFRPPERIRVGGGGPLDGGRLGCGRG